MKKKIITMLICMSVFSQTLIAFSAQQFEQQTIDGTMTDEALSGETTEPMKEKFILDVGMMSEKQIKALNQKFTKLDLRGVVNRDIKDDVEGDRKGGWSDQGENDLRQFDMFGNQEMLGVPFNFINPQENNGKAVLGIRGQNDTGLPTSVTVPVGKTAAGAYFIQASPFCAGTCGTYTWVYSDGSESSIDIVQNEHICDFWGTRSYDFVRPAWTVTKADGSIRSLYLFAMNNPHPDKQIKELRLETEGGGAYIMIMAITLTDIGPYLTKTKSSESITTTTYGWYEFSQPDEEKVKNSAIDFSYLLDAPAGKHGKLVASGESFKFEDGEDASFWGTEITGNACFPDKAVAETMASRIARLGYNLVKFSEFDEAILKQSDKTEIDTDKLDKMAYFMAELKERGVYSYVSFLSERRLRANDGVENYADFAKGYGIDAFFDEKLMLMQKSFISEFLGYNNPYTGKTIGEDEALVMAELVGELSLFDYHNGYGRNAFANNAQYEKARVRFNEFLSKKYNKTENLLKNWTSIYDKNDYETIEDKSIELKSGFEYNLMSNGMKKDVREFFGKVLDEYFEELSPILKSNNIQVTINSNEPNKGYLSDTLKNADSDFVTRNYYNAKPYGLNDKISLNSVFNQYNSMTKTYDNFIVDFANNAPYGKPYVANWGSAQQNIYFAEASVMMAAFSGQKNWMAIEHSFANDEYSDKNFFTDFYAVYNNPVRLALAPVAASIFHNSEKAEAEVLNVTINDTQANFATTDVFAKNTRVNNSNESNLTSNKAASKTLKTDTMYQNTEIGLFEFRSDNTEALSGFLTEKEEMPTFSISVDNSFVTVALTAIDGKSIKKSDRYIFTAVGTTQNYKSRINLIRNRYDLLGEERIVTETVTGTLTIKQKGKFEVYPLTSSGERKAKLSVNYDRSGYPSFALLSSSEAVQYEIVKTGE